MPLVHISLKQDAPAAVRRAIADTIHEAMVDAIGVPADDRFQIMSRHGEDLIYHPTYLGIPRTDGIIIVQITLSTGRTVDQKKALYRTIAERLAADHDIRPEDVFVTLVEIARENWSFGNGIAQYADAPPPHLAAGG
jgi:phenylpyruvate tautomerase PptA (4-oxalocrotonate tautomerase family)